MGITIKNLKEFLATLPEEFDSYGLMNGEYGKANDEHYYRLDKPIIHMMVDEDTEELCILHQSEEEIDTIIEGDKQETDDKQEITE